MQSTRISVTGLGYVGLPVAAAFAKHYSVIGFDISNKRVNELQQGIDTTLETDERDLKQTSLTFTTDPAKLSAANFHIIAVPTPINDSKQPDLTPLIEATKSIAAHLKKGDIVVYESTVYPGATEEICLPLLEKMSGLTLNNDFSLGYSPERINPGDKQHTLATIKKIVSGSNPDALETIATVYGSVVTAGIHRASSIQVAEAAKIIENTQRDLNIALMNELAMIFKRLNIDTLEVIECASTKWNFLPFKPGLVGGHCIGVDPYYLTHKAEQLNYHPEVILAGRRINDNMGSFIAGQVIKFMLQQGHIIQGARLGVLGLTFKENCPDLRNSKVVDLIDELGSYHVNPLVHDPKACSESAMNYYGIELVDMSAMQNLQAIIIAVAHEDYRQMTPAMYQSLLKPNGIIFDIKGILNPDEFRGTGIKIWRL